MPVSRGLILAIAGLMIAGCAPQASRPVPIELGDPPPSAYTLANLPRAGDAPAASTAAKSAAAKIPCPPAGGVELDSAYFDLRHDAIEPYLDVYLDSGRRSLENALSRSIAYVPRFQKTLEAEGLPPELAYLPIVESHFKNTARSRAGAVGLWQFMPRTAQRYGLRVDRCVDERRDPQLATRAAAHYLSELHDRFDDWHLALAAYNAGEGTIARVLRDSDADDYWELAERGLLPRETCSFVPKFLAAVTVAQRAPDLGFELTPASPVTWQHANFPVDRPVSLATIARLAGTDVKRIRELNPALQCDRVPSGGYTVRIPADKINRFKLAYAKLESDTALASADTHRVRRGESCASIARHYGVSVTALMKVNRIRNPRRLRVNTDLTIPREPI